MHLDQLPGSFFGPSNLVELLRHRAVHQTDKSGFKYLLDGEQDIEHLSFTQLDRKARAIGAMLQRKGLAGERALLLYPSGLDFIAAYFGCLYAGVIAVPAYPPRRNRNMVRVDAIAKDAQAKIALTTQSVLDLVQGMVEENSVLSDIEWRPTESIDDQFAEAWVLPEIHSDTLAFFQYTSGSTGTPKGVMLTHANLLHNSAMINYAFEGTRSDNAVFWLPLYHDMGLIGGVLESIYLGVTTTLFSPSAFLQRPFRWLQAISRNRATISGGPNFAYDLCVDKITEAQKKHLDLSSWEIAFNGAEPIRPSTLDRFSKAFESCGFRREAFYPCYGLAEATLIVTGGYKKAIPATGTFDSEALEQHHAVEAMPDEEGTRTLVGCGGELLDEKVVIVDPKSCVKCPTGRVGEIWVSGLSVAQGYWNRPEESKQTFQARIEGENNGTYMRTGDLGFIHDGELFVTGRLKDLIIIRGVNHYPQDIEQTTEAAHEDLRVCGSAAITVGAEGEEKLVILQEVNRRKGIDHNKIYESIRKAIALDHELSIATIVLLRAGSIPRTSSGKIQHHACKNDFLAGKLSSVGQWPDSEDSGMPQQEIATRRLRQKKVEKQTPSQPTSQPAAMQPMQAAASGTPLENGAVLGQETDDLLLDVTAEAVFEVVRSIAKERATTLTTQTNIIELGLDSLERMEIVAKLEDTFGGQFPLEVIQEMQTCEEVITAVKTHLGELASSDFTTAADAAVPQEAYDFSLFPEYLQLQQTKQLPAKAGLPNPYFGVNQAMSNNRTKIDNKEYINYSSFNYIGMSGDSFVNEAAKKAVEQYGTSVSASRVVSGENPLHGQLETRISELIGTESTLLFVSGHGTNETTIGHLMGPNDLILYDAYAHNSIVQGALLSGARRRPFPHNDFAECDRILSQIRHRYRRVLIAIEGVYSMDGDYADVPAFVEVKKKHGALLMVDEAHSIGTMGLHGRGMSEFYGMNPRDVDIWMGTISKALGSCGGYISGSKELVEYMKYTGPGFVFSVGISPPNTAAALAALQLLEEEPERVAKLSENAALFLRLAKAAGLNVGTSSGTPVVPLITGNSVLALQLSHALMSHGIHVMPILYPAVEESAARLRFFISSLHTEEQIRHTVTALVEELAKLQGGQVTPPNTKQEDVVLRSATDTLKTPK